MTMHSPSDAEAFHQFLTEQLAHGHQGKSPEELLCHWRAQHEYLETVAAVCEGVADMNAARLRPLREILDELHIKPSPTAE